jgi:GntR family transcriptional regulator
VLRRDQRPLYVQAAEGVEELIQQEGFRAGDRLPSEAELGTRLGVSRSTIREGLRELELRGRIDRIHGRGTIVADPSPIVTGLSTLESLESLAARQGWRCGTEAVQIAEVTMPTELEAVLEVAHGSKATHLFRVKTRDWHPVCVMQTWLPSSIISASELRASFGSSISDFLIKNENPHLDYATAEVGATGADSEMAARLHLAVGTPLVQLTETFYENPARPICYSVNLFIPESVRLEIVRRPILQ